MRQTWLVWILVGSCALARTPESVARSAVTIETLGGHGSGTVIGVKDGAALVLTAEHVSIGPDLAVDGRPATIQRRDPSADLAVLAVPGLEREAQALTYGSAALAERCYALWSDRRQTRYSGLEVCQVDFSAQLGPDEWRHHLIAYNGPTAPGCSGAAVWRQADGALLGLLQLGRYNEAPKTAGVAAAAVEAFLKGL